ncbi:hypothetical protein V1264_003414 [Littorina saxatilis]|uniref:RNA helicase n=2 Tax=Littorina saxatilis TaxID=31220 RepID=A0AAN9B5I9_9CAEN
MPCRDSGSGATNASPSQEKYRIRSSDKSELRDKDNAHLTSYDTGSKRADAPLQGKQTNPRKDRCDAREKTSKKQSSSESGPKAPTVSQESHRKPRNNKSEVSRRNNERPKSNASGPEAANASSQQSPLDHKSDRKDEGDTRQHSSKSGPRETNTSPPQRVGKVTTSSGVKHTKDTDTLCQGSTREATSAPCGKERGHHNSKRKITNGDKTKGSSADSSTPRRHQLNINRRQLNDDYEASNDGDSKSPHADQRRQRNKKANSTRKDSSTGETVLHEADESILAKRKTENKHTRRESADMKACQQKLDKRPSLRLSPEKEENRNARTLDTNAAEAKPTKGKTSGERVGSRSQRPQARNTISEENIRSHSHKSEGQKTKLYIRVRQQFEDAESFTTYLKSKSNVEGLEFQPSENSVSEIDGFTYYTLMCPSKSKATNLRQHLNNNKSSPQIHCRLYEFPIMKRSEDEREQRVMIIHKPIFHFDQTSDKLIQIHAQKLREVQKKLKQAIPHRKNFDTFEKINAEIKVLEQKEIELSKQKEEFTIVRDQLKAQLSSSEKKDDFNKQLRVLKDRYYRECYRFDMGLPMYARRREIVELVQNNQVSVILGETGSGKSTQLVQYLQEAWEDAPGVIVCTQPRRVAALTLASHVAGEMQTKVGQKVGYQVGSKQNKSKDTRIMYTTDHSLLNECLADPDLKAYSCVVVDEAHERSLHTDLLLSMIKRCLLRRTDLRVIITSATIEPTVFQTFFGGCPVLRATGRTFPVDVVWRGEDEQDDYLEKAMSTVIDIHTREPPGDILVFVTSPAETEKCCQALKQRMNVKGDFICLQLHGKQQAQEQQKVFWPAPKGKRKVVFATNCAETSITIDGIRYVVDTGRAKEMRYDPRRNLNSLCVTVISKSSADQRKGRAGRTAPGKCYRLYSEETYNEMESVTLPEILRIHLGHALLKLAELGVDKETYEFVQSPSQDTIDSAMKMLHVLGALNGGKITEKGRWIASLPFDPRLGLLTYLGREQGILYDSVVLAAVMSAEGGVFYRGTTEEDQRIHDITKTMFSIDKGDSLTCLSVYKAWSQVPDKGKNQWCVGNGLNAKVLRGVRETVSEVCKALGVKAMTFSPQDKTGQLRKMIFRCYSSSLCYYLGRQNAGYFAALASRRVHIHPSSCICALASVPEWVVYDQLIQTSRDFITGVTPVDESWLQELATQDIGFNPDEVRQKTVEKVYSRQVGSKAFFAVVGPCFSRLRELEASFPAASSSVVVIEAARDDGEISVYCTGDASATETLTAVLESSINTAVEEAEMEDREEVVAGSPKQGIRAVLGQGGQVQEILLCDQSRKLFIKKPHLEKDNAKNATDEITAEEAGTEETPSGEMIRDNAENASDEIAAKEATAEEAANEKAAIGEMIREKFSEFGEIKYCKQFDHGKNWGFLIFKRSEDAERAERCTKFEEGFTGQVEHRRQNKDETSFRLHLSWCRRPCLGFARVVVTRRFFARCLQLRHFHVDAHEVTIKPNHRGRETLRLEGITNTMTEDLVQRSLLYALGAEEGAGDIVLDVYIARRNTFTTRPSDEDKIKQQIRDLFRITETYVHVHRLEDNDDVTSRVTVKFRDPAEGSAAFEKLRSIGSDLYLDGQLVEMRPLATIEVELKAQTLELCRADLEEAREILANQDVHVQLREEDAGIEENSIGSRTLLIKTDRMEAAVEARSFLDLAMRGEVVDCSGVQMLFTAEGAQLLQNMERDTGSKVTKNVWSRTITIHGLGRSRLEMRHRLEQLTRQLQDIEEDIHTLKGEDKPPGLMKAVVMEFSEDLSRLRSATGIQAAVLDFRRHRLRVSGSRDSLVKVAAELEKIKEALWSKSNAQRPGGETAKPREMCSVCTCLIEVGQLYRLELCAHPFCKDCLKQQVYYAVRDKAVPIVCCHEDCERPLALRDVRNMVRSQAHLNMAALVQAAVTAFLSRNPNFKHCPTPDCPAVYKATERSLYDTSWRYGRALRTSALGGFEDASVFVCPACCTSTCTACHKSAHSGRACLPAGSQDDIASEPELKDWVSRDQDNRKQCPRCRHMIEKIAGCNKMVCMSCKAIFCWVCLKTFSTGSDCEDHLIEVHGGIFPRNYGRRPRYF